MMFHGVMTALVTPFTADGAIDEDALRAHIDRQIADGVDAIAPAGTTGEAATLNMAEHKRVIRIAVEHAAGRVPVIAGSGSNSTEESIELTRAAKEIGADAALLISPYYVKPSQEGIYQHYKAVAEAVHIPQIMYNVPGRTHSNMLPDTVARLSRVPNIVGIKDATADMAQLTRTMLACEERIEFYSGDDATVMPLMALGGVGVISVVSNIVPASMKRLTGAMRAGDLAAARTIHRQLQLLTDAMFVESNPVPVKGACAMLGWMGETLRLPLVPMPVANRAVVRQAMLAFEAETLVLQAGG
jgi:4-hydroxy-tetrahydrodipicolinate synthase